MKQNEDMLDLFANLIEPAAEIFSDPNAIKLTKKNDRAHTASVLIKDHKTAIVKILALLDGVEPEDYVVPGPFVLAGKIINLLNDPELEELFTSQGQKEESASSGSATENIEDGAN